MRISDWSSDVCSSDLKMFALVSEAVASVLPPEQLRYIGFSHVEADECGSLNEWLAAPPQSAPLCGTVAGMVSISDLADRQPRVLNDTSAVRRVGQQGVMTFRSRWSLEQ